MKKPEDSKISAPQCVKLNYIPNLSRTKRIINQSSSIHLRPIGKISLIKNFLIPEVVYLFLFYQTEELIILELGSLFYGFRLLDVTNLIKLEKYFNH